QKSISDYLDIKDIERYSGTNPLGLYIGLHYFYHLYKIILMNGVSDVEYLRSLFGSLKSCIGLIQNIKDLFILLFEINRDQILKDLDKYLDSFGKLKDIESIEYKKYYEHQSPKSQNNLFTNESDIVILDIIMESSNTNDERIYAKVRSLTMNSWILILSQGTETNNKDKSQMMMMIEEGKYSYNPTSGVINTYYFNHFLKEYNIYDILFNNYTINFKSNGILLKANDIINEANKIKRISNEISYKNIVNICKIRNID